MNWTGSDGPRAGTAPSSRSQVISSSNALGFALLIALASRMSLPIPGTPVPATLQTLAVLLAGGLLGPWGGVASVLVYLGAGLAGAPVFAMGGGPAYLLGPTGGYLIGLLPAAWIAGLLSRRTDRLLYLVPGFLLASLAIHLSGWAQLSAFAGTVPAFGMGVAPFLAFDALKVLVAAAVVRNRRRSAARKRASREESFS